LRRFDYLAPRSVQEAITVLCENSPDALPMAGGTDLLVRMKQNFCTPKMIIDLAQIPEFRGIELTDQGLRIGTMVTHTEIITSPLIKRYAPVIAAASASVGALQTRNTGTIGGNLMACIPSNDSPPPLLVLDARVTVVGKNGKRQLMLEEFFVSPRCSAVGPDELLAEILIPSEHFGKSSSFAKFGRRKTMTLALVNVAASVEIGRTRDCFDHVRLALGAVAPTPIRARKAEAFLAGRPVSGEALIQAGRIAAEEAKPIDDFRASAQYRRELIAVLAHRVLEEALSHQ
jgi:carbon-monoxide dehydrogenase medium subunit